MVDPRCSKESTSRQIHEVFENALRAKKRMDLEQEKMLIWMGLDEYFLPYVVDLDHLDLLESVVETFDDMGYGLQQNYYSIVFHN